MNPDYWRYLLSKVPGFHYRPPLPDFPEMVLAEVTNDCNLACIHCARRYLIKEQALQVEYMPFSLYKAVIDEVVTHPKTIFRPFSSGEPFKHPELMDFLEFTKKTGDVYVWINTNGTLVSDKNCSRLMELNINRIEISLDAVTRETYDKIRIGGNFSRAVATVESLLKYREKYNSTSRIDVSFVENSLNTHERDLFIATWEQRVNTVYIRPVHKHGANVDSEIPLEVSSTPRATFRRPCPFLWQRLKIASSGDIRLCEFDWRGKTSLGKVPDVRLIDVWQGPLMEKYRSLAVKGRFNEIPLCDECESYHVINW